MKKITELTNFEIESLIDKMNYDIDIINIKGADKSYGDIVTDEDDEDILLSVYVKDIKRDIENGLVVATVEYGAVLDNYTSTIKLYDDHAEFDGIVRDDDIKEINKKYEAMKTQVLEKEPGEN